MPYLTNMKSNILDDKNILKKFRGQYKVSG